MPRVHCISPRKSSVARYIAVWAAAFALVQPGYAQEELGADLSDRDRDKLIEELELEASLLERQGNILKKVAKLVTPTVVHIDAAKAQDLTARSRRRIEEAGSGVIIELDGKHFVLTNRHVIKSASMGNIKIKLADGRQLHPTKIWADPQTDVAVMAVSASGLNAARIGDSDRMEIGDFVVAVGSPFGLSHSVTYGIISAKGRRDLELGDEGVDNQDFIQTDAAINPGNSGGPLINLRGEVVGLNTAIASSSGGSEGIGFSIPINMAMVIAKQLIERGAVVRAYIGVSLDGKFDFAKATSMGLPRIGGARVSGIVRGAPGEIAGLREDDVIIEFNGVRIESGSHLINLVSLTEVGKQVPVTIYRNGRQMDLTVKVGSRSDFE